MRKYAKEMEIPPLHSKHRPAREIPIMATTAIATIQPTTNSNHYTHLTTPHLWILHIYNSQIEFSNQKKHFYYHLLSERKHPRHPATAELRRLATPDLSPPNRLFAAAPSAEPNVYGTVQRPRSRPEQDLRKISG